MPAGTAIVPVGGVPLAPILGAFTAGASLDETAVGAVARAAGVGVTGAGGTAPFGTSFWSAGGITRAGRCEADGAGRRVVRGSAITTARARPIPFLGTGSRRCASRDRPTGASGACGRGHYGALVGGGCGGYGGVLVTSFADASRACAVPFSTDGRLCGCHERTSRTVSPVAAVASGASRGTVPTSRGCARSFGVDVANALAPVNLRFSVATLGCRTGAGCPSSCSYASSRCGASTSSTVINAGANVIGIGFSRRGRRCRLGA